MKVTMEGLTLVLFLLATCIEDVTSTTEHGYWHGDVRCRSGKAVHMWWVDQYWEKLHRTTHDLFYDRLVFLRHDGVYGSHLNPSARKKYKVIDHTYMQLAVVIDRRLILTSYNSWKPVLRSTFKRHSTIVCMLVGRIFKGTPFTTFYYIVSGFNVRCARQVVPILDEELPDELWQGFTYQHRMHSPLHDLMVVRVATEIDYVSHHINAENQKQRYHWTFNYERTIYQRPILTILADRHEPLGREVHFVSLGHEDLRQMRNYNITILSSFKHDENAVADCDEWVPREWGHFICLNNLNHFAGLANGAMLFSNEKLFGVGSFMILKGNSSVLVFTDVRPYKHLLFNICTFDDQDLVMPKHPPTSL